MSSANYKFNSVFAFFAKASGAVAALLTTMLLTRMLSEADFASFALAYTVVMLGSILGPLGMGNAILRFAGSFLGSGRPAAARNVTRRCVAMGMMGLLVLACLLALLHAPIGSHFVAWPEGWAAAALVSVWLVGAGLLLLVTSGLRAYGKIALGSVTEITVPRFAILATISLLYFQGIDSLLVVFAAMSGVVLLSAAWSIIALERTLPRDKAQSDDSVPRSEIASFALPILGSNVLFQLMTDVTLFAVAFYFGKAEVAIYGAAYRVWGVFGLPQSAVATAIQGRIAELHAAKDMRGLETLVKNSALLAMWPTLLITVVVCVAAGPILGLLFSDFYAAGAQVLVILCLAQLLFVLIGPSEHLMQMTGRKRSVLMASILAAVLAIVLAWSLAPWLGLIGAALAGGSAIVTYKLILSWLAWRDFGIRTWVDPRDIFRNSGTSTLGGATINGEPLPGTAPRNTSTTRLHAKT